MLHSQEPRPSSRSTSPDSPDASTPPGPSPPTDEDAPESLTNDVLQALRDGDPGAFERWIYVHRDFLLHFLLRIVNDKAVAQELLQETFFQALRSLSSFRGDSKISTWLCGIARNLAYNHFRSQDRYTTTESKTLEYMDYAAGDRTSYAPDHNPRAHAERNERRQMVHAALDQLPDSYRQVIRLRDLEERSTKEVAHELDLTRGNVRVRLHRARKKLKGLLDSQLTPEHRLAT